MKIKKLHLARGDALQVGDTIIWDPVPEIHEFRCYCTPNFNHQNIGSSK